MLLRAADTFWVRLFTVLLVASSLAGCTNGGDEEPGTADGDTEPTNPTDEFPDEGDTGGSGSDGRTSSRPVEERAVESVAAALERLETDEDHYVFDMQSHSKSFGSLLQTLYVAAPESVTFYHFREADGTEETLVGQSGKTLFAGTANTSLRVVHVASTPDLTSQRSFAEGYYSGSSPIGGLTPYFSAQQALMSAGFVPGYAAGTVEQTVVDGVEVTRIVIGESTIVMDAQMERLLSARIVEEDFDGKRYANATWRYGQDATHPWVEPLQRVETLTPYDPAEFRALQQGRSDETSMTLTLQPSTRAPVPLGDLEAHVYSSRDTPGKHEPKLVVPLLDGTGATSDVEFEFEDVDGDGAASEGDTVTHTVISQRSDVGDFRVFLVDTKTGFHILAS